MRHVVGVADMKVSADPSDQLLTYALGSCLGITVYDPVAKVGGLLHVMLPLSTIDPVRAAENPYMFVDTGVPRLFRACYEAGAQKQRVEVKVVGGACTGGWEEDDYFQIGRRNVVVLRKLLRRNGVVLAAEDVGGTVSRTVELDIGTGQVTVRTYGQVRLL